MQTPLHQSAVQKITILRYKVSYLNSLPTIDHDELNFFISTL